MEKVAKPLEDSHTQPVFCTHLQPDLQLASTSFHFPLPELSRLGLSWLLSVTWGIYFSKHQAALKRMSSDQLQPWLLLRTTRGYDPPAAVFFYLVCDRLATVSRGGIFSPEVSLPLSSVSLSKHRQAESRTSSGVPVSVILLFSCVHAVSC